MSLEAFKPALWPLRSTTQEKWLKALVRTRQDKVTIITGFRGIRKTTTAKRVTWRNMHPLYKITYVQSSTWANFEAKHSPFMTLASDGMRRVLFAVLCGALLLARDFFRNGKPADENQDPSKANLTLVRRAVGFVSVCVASLAMMGLLRRNVYIFDDITRMVDPHLYRTKEEQLQAIRRRLNIIAGLESVANVFVLTENEGLHWCYSDINSSVRITVTMPAAAQSELEFALCGMFGSQISSAQLHSIMEKAMNHHARSVRFYGEICLPVLSDGMAGHYRFEHWETDRRRLWNVVTNLDLACEPSLAAATLSMNPLLEDEDLERLRNLALGLDRSVDVAKFHTLPRRLALTFAMVSTSPYNLAKVHELLCSKDAPVSELGVMMSEGESLLSVFELLPAAPTAELNPVVRESHSEYIVPLRELVLEKLTVKGGDLTPLRFPAGNPGEEKLLDALNFSWANPDHIVAATAALVGKLRRLAGPRSVHL
jgi:hypothetical protein